MLYDTELALGQGAAAPQAVRNLRVAHSVSEAAAALLCSSLMLCSIDVVLMVQVVTGWIPFLVAVGFGLVMLCDVPPVRLCAELVATAVRSAFVCSLTLLPALFQIMQRRQFFVRANRWAMATAQAVVLVQVLLLGGLGSTPSADASADGQTKSPASRGLQCVAVPALSADALMHWVAGRPEGSTLQRRVRNTACA